MGYRDVLNTIHESYEYIPVRSPYILHLHRDLLKRTGLLYGGHFKNTQNYAPVPAYDTPEAVKRLCDAYALALASEQIDTLLLIPVFICDFLCIHPFNDGNGRMSRLFLHVTPILKNGWTWWQLTARRAAPMMLLKTT